MNTIKKPTIGRVVIFYPNGASEHEFRGGTSAPGIVNGVHDDNLTLNMAILVPDTSNPPARHKLFVPHKSLLTTDEYGNLTPGTPYWDYPEITAEEIILPEPQVVITAKESTNEVVVTESHNPEGEVTVPVVALEVGEVDATVIADGNTQGGDGSVTVPEGELIALTDVNGTANDAIGTTFSVANAEPVVSEENKG